MSDDELRGQTAAFKERIAKGETTDDLLVEAFAVVREAAKRTLGQRHFDVQLMGGAALHLGDIAEMKTGEGKTLVSTLPAYLNALEGKGVHVVTVNDYLAKRDSEWMGRVHRFLGLDVGVILSQQTPEVRKAAVRRRHHLRHQQRVRLRLPARQHGLVEERPGPARPPLRDRRRGRLDPDRRGQDAVDHLRAGRPVVEVVLGVRPAGARGCARRRCVDYEVDESKRTVGVSEEGVAKVEQALGIENLYESVNTPLVGFLNNALKAKELYKKDRDYIVVSGEVLIVDEFTGRVLHGRRYNEGMHQAIEAKEGVEIKAENQTLATITLQNYFRLYEKLSGMTGTAQTEAAELHQTYKLGVVPIPPNKPIQRARRGRPDLQDRGRQVRRGRRGPGRTAREGPAGAGRHRLGGEVRAAEQAAAAGRRAARGAERQEPRPGGGDHRAGRPVRRRHRRHQHGRSRHRHRAGRQRRLHRRPRPARAGA